MEISSAQVQAIGLQVLKNMVQKGMNIEDNTFVIFLVGEHIRDIFSITQKMLKVFSFFFLMFQFFVWIRDCNPFTCSTSVFYHSNGFVLFYQWQKPLTKESVTVVGECLRILVLLQTVSKGSESQRCFMNLLFEAIVMVFLASEDELSQVIYI